MDELYEILLLVILYHYNFILMCWRQVIRSVGQWSAGTSQTEESIHNAYFSLIEKAEHFIYIEVRILWIYCANLCNVQITCWLL